jgi:hypothetical protein
MRKLRLKRPSPALIVACVALFAALGGTSYALGIGSIGSAEIRDGSIRNVDFKDGTLRGNEFKRDSLGGGAIKEQALDGTKIPQVASAKKADTATTATTATTAAGLTRQVLVAANGAKSNDRGVVSVAKLADGRYQAIFDTDVRSCGLSATLVEQPPPVGDPTAPVTGQIAVAPLDGNANGIHISTTDSAGAYADRSFHLLVSC